jgi:hypothetical protein
MYLNKHRTFSNLLCLDYGWDTKITIHQQDLTTTHHFFRTEKSCIEISFKSWLLAVKSSVPSLDCRANSYHIQLNLLDPSAYGIEISQEYPYPKWPINRFLRAAHLLPSNSTLWHSHSGGNPNQQLPRLTRAIITFKFLARALIFRSNGC